MVCRLKPGLQRFVTEFEDTLLGQSQPLCGGIGAGLGRGLPPFVVGRDQGEPDFSPQKRTGCAPLKERGFGRTLRRRGVLASPFDSEAHLSLLAFRTTPCPGGDVLAEKCGLRIGRRTTWGLSRFSRSENGTLPRHNAEVILPALLIGQRHLAKITQHIVLTTPPAIQHLVPFGLSGAVQLTRAGLSQSGPSRCRVGHGK